MRTFLKRFLTLIVFNILYIKPVLASSYDSITYNLSTKNLQENILNIEVILQGDLKDKITLDLPSWWADSMYFEQVKNISISAGYKMSVLHNENDVQAVITVPKENDYELKINYELHQKSGNPSHVHDVIIRKDLVHSPGYGIFATPNDLKTDEKINIIINWYNVDTEWDTVSSHGIERNIRKKLSMPELLHAIYVAGNIRCFQIGDQTNSVYLSLYGMFDIEDNKIISDIKNIIHNQRKFFQDHDFPYYAISLIQGDNERSMGGTRLHNSFTAYLPKGMTQSEYYSLLAHEHLHNWIGGKIQNNNDEELNYWWTEGFTDFYSRLIAYRAGSIDSSSFINEVNDFLLSYYLSPVTKEPNSRIKKDFWNNYDIEKLPYYRGFVFAIYLNDLIKQNNPNNSLDNIMRDLLDASSENKFSSSLFKKVAKKYIDNIDQLMSNFIDKGEIITLDHIKLPIEKKLIGEYYIGFNRENFLNKMQITDIDVNSNAFKAGLRNEQKVLNYDVPKGYGYPNQIISIQTNDGVHKFIPEHYSNKVMIFQIKENMSTNDSHIFSCFFQE